MSGPEDFKLGHKHNAGDPAGRRVMKELPECCKAAVVDAFREWTMRGRVAAVPLSEMLAETPRYLGGMKKGESALLKDLPLAPPDAHPPTSAEPTAWQKEAYELLCMAGDELGQEDHWDDLEDRIQEFIKRGIPPTSAEPLGWVHPDDVEGDRPGESYVLVYAHPPTSAEPVTDAEVGAVTFALTEAIRISGEKSVYFAAVDAIALLRSLSKDAATVRSLSKELADLQHDMSGYMDANTQYVNEIESLSKDAERYREARHMGIHSYGIPRYRQDADISVDAALAAKEQK